jgi:trehalose/maltose transport system substrate-binding protein
MSQPVEIFSTPNDSNDRLALYQQLLGAKSTDIDVYQVDVVWPGILASHFIDFNPYMTPKEVKAFIPETIKNNSVGGKLVAVPWFMDGGVLYYRKDLLAKYKQKVPETWEELGKIAALITEKEKAAGNKDLWGYVYQGRAYEGLTCNALEWVHSYGGGNVVEPNGKLSVNNPNTVKALSLFAGWVGKITPSGVLNYSEEEARGTFQSGKSVFMRNWPYAWALLNSADSPVLSKVGMVALPSGSKGGVRASTLGGWSLAVSSYSKFPALAADLVKYLTSEEEQKRRNLVASFNPTREALYSNKELLKKNPYLKELKPVFLSAVPRPATVTNQKYNRLSADFWNAVHSVLSGSQSAPDSLKGLEQKVAGYSNSEKW